MPLDHPCEPERLHAGRLLKSLGFGIEQQRPVDLTEVVHRLDEAIYILVLQWQAQRRKSPPRKVDSSLQHLEVEQRLKLGVIGDVLRAPDRASMDVDDIERTLPEHLHRHSVAVENLVHSLTQAIAPRVEVVSGFRGVNLRSATTPAAIVSVLL